MSSRVLLLPHSINANIYVRELGRAYQAEGLKVIFNADNLAECNDVPDILHLHWPEEQYRWTGSGSVESRAEAFLLRLQALKKAGAQIVWTVHNLAPHEHFHSELDQRVYQSVAQAADVIHHHCAYSQQALSQRYRIPGHGKHVIVPHGNFMGYPSGARRADARSELNIPQDSVVYLQFGQVRAYKGLDLMLRAFDKARVKNKFLLVAGRYSPTGGKAKLGERLRMIWLKRFKPNTRFVLHEVPSDQIQQFMAAADALVLTHTAGLNSGAAVLGMSFGKPVVAPQLGCIDSVIGSESGLLYPVGNLPRLVQAMQHVATADLEAIGERNFATASRWAWSDIAQSVLRALA